MTRQIFKKWNRTYTSAHHSQRFPRKLIKISREEHIQTALLFAVIECLADSGDERVAEVADFTLIAKGLAMLFKL